MPGAQLLFIMELADNYYYVGASPNPAKALREHTRGTADCAWTTLHRPLRLLLCREQPPPQEEEDEEADEHPLERAVVNAMARRGVARVRGGPYASVRLPDETRKALRERTREMRHAMAEEAKNVGS